MELVGRSDAGAEYRGALVSARPAPAREHAARERADAAGALGAPADRGAALPHAASAHAGAVSDAGTAAARPDALQTAHPAAALGTLLAIAQRGGLSSWSPWASSRRRAWRAVRTRRAWRLPVAGAATAVLGAPTGPALGLRAVRIRQLDVAAKARGEAANLSLAAGAAAAAMCALGLAIGGEASPSLAAAVPGAGALRAPGTLLVRASARVPDVRRVAGARPRAAGAARRRSRRLHQLHELHQLHQLHQLRQLRDQLHHGAAAR